MRRGCVRGCAKVGVLGVRERVSEGVKDLRGECC